MTIEQMQKEILELRFIGQQMSNVCYNLSQHNETSLRDEERKNMAALVRRWDAIPRTT